MNNLINSKKSIYKLIIAISIIIYIIYLITAIVSNRSLYADGADFYVCIVNNINNFWPYFDDSQHIRLFVNLINQFPMSLALSCGIRRMDILRILFGMPLFVNNLIGMSICIWISYRAKKIWVAIFPLSSYVLFCMLSEIFIVNQAFLSFWLYYIAFLYLALEVKWKYYDWILVLSVLVASYRSHEGILVYGPLIILYFIINWKKLNSTNKFKKYIVISTLFEIIYAAWWQIVHPVKEQTEGYLMLLKMLLNPKELFTSNMFFSIIGIILLMCVLLFGYKFDKIKNRIIYYNILFVFTIISVAFGILHMKGIAINPVSEFNYRVFITFGGAGFMFLFILFDKFKLENRINIKLCFITIAIILMVQSIWQIGNNYQWNKLKNVVKQQIVNSNNAIIKPEEIGLMDNNLASNKYQWSWTGPVFSIALHDSLSINSILLPYEYNQKPNFDVNLKEKKLIVPFIEISNNVYNLEEFFQNYTSKNTCKIGSKIQVGKNPDIINYLSYGWASPEDWGVWSDSKEAGIQLMIKKYNKEKDIIFRGIFSGYVSQDPQIIELYANEKLIGEWKFNSYNSGEERSIQIPRDILKNGEELNIKFKISNPTSPASAGISNDTRTLGIGMQWFIIEQ